MTVVNLRSCDPVLAELRQSNLLTPDQLLLASQELSQLVEQHPEASPQDALECLVSSGYLSAYQSQMVAQGRAADLVVRDYTLLEPLGDGIVAPAFRAIHRTQGTMVDIEVLRQKSKWNTFAAFRQKKAFSGIQHPSILPFLDVGTVNGILYLVWPQSQGERLDERVAREGPLPIPQVLDLGIQMADGLRMCHEKGVFHGLLNPSSVLLQPNGGVILHHFGIGGLMADQQAESLLNTRATAQALDVGLECASLETALNPRERDPLSDQHSLGAVLYFALTGRYPFTEPNPVKKLVMMKEGKYPPAQQYNPAVTERLAATLTQLMHRDRNQRFAEMGEVVKALRRARGSGETPVPVLRPTPLPVRKLEAVVAPPEAPELPMTPNRGQMVAVAGFLGAIIALAIAGACWYFH